MLLLLLLLLLLLPLLLLLLELLLLDRLLLLLLDLLVPLLLWQVLLLLLLWPVPRFLLGRCGFASCAPPPANNLRDHGQQNSKKTRAKSGGPVVLVGRPLLLRLRLDRVGEAV